MRLRAFLLPFLSLACAAPQKPAPPAPPAPGPGEVLVLARQRRDAGDLAGARAILRKLAAEDAGWALPRLDLAAVDLELGKLDEAKQAVGEALALHPDNPRAHRLAGALAEQAGDDAAAAASYARSLALRDDLDLRLRRGIVLARLGRREEAVQELARVERARPDDAQAHQNLAELYEALGRTADAEAELTALVNQRPGQVPPLAALQRFYERTGNTAMAKATARQLGELSSHRALRPLRPSRH